jgi:hypothetical protein
VPQEWQYFYWRYSQHHRSNHNAHKQTFYHSDTIHPEQGEYGSSCGWYISGQEKQVLRHVLSP